MIRLFNVYYSTRTIILLMCEALIVSGSFLLSTVLILGPDTYICLNYEYGVIKIAALTILTLLLSYYFDLYEPQRISERWEIYFRLLLVLGFLSFLLSAVIYFFPQVDIAHYVLLLGLMFLTLGLVLWRGAYEWIIGREVFRERVYVLGGGDRARMIADTLRLRKDAGMEVVGFEPMPVDKGERREAFSMALESFRGRNPGIDRVVIALEDRRGELPLRELLKLRFDGVVIEEAGALLERLTGKLYLDGLRPSNFIYSEGFRVKPSQQFARRIVSTLTAAAGLLLFLPLLPFVVLAVRLSSSGPIFFRQVRVGMGGRNFTVYKFRTMRTDAEIAGAKWASKDDPRATKVGGFMRKTRLDEVPQLWNVLRGDMGFVGPRPERPEFVPWLSENIPYFDLRHMIRPGLTGWAQVRYGYGSTLEEAREKLEYDLYYIKHMTLGLDLLIMFETIKTILRRRGAQ
ncbi:TIGR03013 family XrtA/PEP-CTERM system glycosyltransferase [Edaphobacter modestus]|uniref:Sugar transferase (PEP-CTERM system associated)/exopolysaccharide biosynthesis polyprenyl glycosylphosphotransferase n=1 Tax=Edaphobacter modestus TaxID=388466 RepID=A0A4Q7YX90_9BACT|nr:TIGR03013 family XrtA/PEP-CTERM system glycosyltransferase [Edaphobacter modestus]RZU42457.1 sugar transferase (PEP-CTERM system associated)/exopolysaccharide biosynthesis polyprenyl glycosylphosphotransferase [Edaphobacter modestus]